MNADISVRLAGHTKVTGDYAAPHTIPLEHSPDLVTPATVWVRFDTGDGCLTVRGTTDELVAVLTAALAAAKAAIPDEDGVS